jgi:hypothetical protein
VRGTTVITEKTKIYCSESQRVSAGPSVKGKLQGNEDYKVNVVAFSQCSSRTVWTSGCDLKRCSWTTAI